MSTVISCKSLKRRRRQIRKVVSRSDHIQRGNQDVEEIDRASAYVERQNTTHNVAHLDS